MVGLEHCGAWSIAGEIASTEWKAAAPEFVNEINDIQAVLRLLESFN
jgi:hypothetical protein